MRWLTTAWLGVAQRKDWVNTRLVDRLIVESIPGTSHHHFRTKLITSSITLFMLRTTNQAAIWKHLFVSICDRKDWAVIYFDAVHRCSTHKNIIIFQETKLGIFAYWAFRNPFDAVHISKISSKYSRNGQSTALIEIFRSHLVKEIPEYRKCQNWYIDVLGSS